MHGLISASAQKFTVAFGVAEVWNVFQVINLYLVHMERGKQALAQVQEGFVGMIAVFFVVSQ